LQLLFLKNRRSGYNPSGSRRPSKRFTEK